MCYELAWPVLAIVPGYTQDIALVAWANTQTHTGFNTKGKSALTESKFFAIHLFCCLKCFPGGAIIKFCDYGWLECCVRLRLVSWAMAMAPEVNSNEVLWA